MTRDELETAVRDYMDAVLDGSIVACVATRQAVERFLRDEERDDLRMDWEAAAKVVRFVHLLPYTKGEWAKPGRDEGNLIRLMPWQLFFVSNVFGWYVVGGERDGLRRFRLVYLQTSRKSGKTELAAALSLYCAFFDKEPGAETYSVATKRDQAKIVFSAAQQMVRGSVFRDHLDVLRFNISDVSSGSKYEPLSSDASTLDGLSPSAVVCDELHAHPPDGEIFGKMETATGARQQPLILVTTTPGYERNHICYRIYDYSKKVLDGTNDDDTVCPMIFEADRDDDWTQESTWRKANPGLGITPKLSDLQAKCEKAKAIPAEVQIFRRMHCGEWTESSERWLSIESWDACKDPKVASLEHLRGKTCYGGLDLARSRDLSALCLYFPEERALLGWYWIPEEDIVERTRRDRVPYDVWRDRKLVEVTPGNVTDFAFIKARVLELCETFDVREIAFDRFNAGQLVTELQEEGLTMVGFGQGFVSMSGPTSELERQVIGRELKHNGDPVLRWAASNVVVRQDPAGNLKPDKAKSTERIDPVVAAVMAIGLGMVHLDRKSHLDRHGELLEL